MELEEYLVELATQDLDPSERAQEYVEVALGLLIQAQEGLRKGDVRQAAEKLWGAAALTVKAFAEWREGRRLASHKELWDYTLVLQRELGGWVHDAWMSANGMHTCFYEGWCSKEHVKNSMEEIEKLVKAVKDRIAKTLQNFN